MERGSGRRGRPRSVHTVPSTRARKRGRTAFAAAFAPKIVELPTKEQIVPAPTEEDEDEETSGFSVQQMITETDEEKSRTRFLLEHFDEEQMERYEAFRRANLNKSGIKKLAGTIFGQTITQSTAVAIAGFSKIFVGEIVELALDIQEECGENGPLKPDHLRQAFQRYKQYKPFESEVNRMF